MVVAAIAVVICEMQHNAVQDVYVVAAPPTCSILTMQAPFHPPCKPTLTFNETAPPC